jgi:hypothetical protein
MAVWNWYLARAMWVRIVIAVVAVFVVLAIVGSFTAEDEVTDQAAAPSPAPTSDVAADARDQPTATPATVADVTPSPVPSATPAPTPPSAPQLRDTASLQPGSQIKVGGLVITLNQIIDPFTSANQFSRPAAGERFVVIDVTLTNDADRPYSFNTLFDWKLQDDQSFTHDADIGVLTDPFLGTGTLQVKGDTSRGFVGFSIPTGVAIRNIQFNSLTSTNQGLFTQ